MLSAAVFPAHAIPLVDALVEEDDIGCSLPAHATTLVRIHQAGLRAQAFGGCRRGLDLKVLAGQLGGFGGTGGRSGSTTPEDHPGSPLSPLCPPRRPSRMKNPTR